MNAGELVASAIGFLTFVLGAAAFSSSRSERHQIRERQQFADLSAPFLVRLTAVEQRLDRLSSDMHEQRRGGRRD